jgi:hypothetical protein
MEEVLGRRCSDGEAVQNGGLLGSAFFAAEGVDVDVVLDSGALIVLRATRRSSGS